MASSVYDEILDRNEPQRIIAEKYKDLLFLLQDVINYGTQLIVRCYKESRKNEEDIVILAHFLKQGVALLDSIEVQLRSGAVLTSHITARSLLENYILTKWILNSDKERKTQQFFAASLREKRLFASRMLVGSEDHSAYADALKRMGEKYSDSELKKRKKHVEQQIQAIDNILTSDKYESINEEFVKCRKKKPYESAWYSPPSCKTSIWSIAKEIGMQGEYAILYSMLSTVTHNAAFSKHVSFGDGTIIFEPVRSLENIGTIASLSISFTLSLYLLILKEYRPAEIANFDRKYGDEWRSKYLNIRNLIVQPDYQDIDT